jgi:hypothetical protein
MSRPDGVYPGDPELLPGNYEVAAECMQEYWPWNEPAPVVLYTYRTSLVVAEAGRHISLEPEAASPGATITIAPDAPCVGVAGQSIYVYLYPSNGPYPGDSSFFLGTTSASCDWAPLTFVLPSTLSPGQYRAEVIVSEPPPLDGDFVYLPALLDVTQ